MSELPRQRWLVAAGPAATFGLGILAERYGIVVGVMDYTLAVLGAVGVHLALTGISVAGAVLFGLPLGLWISRHRPMYRSDDPAVLVTYGTLPALAVFGISWCLLGSGNGAGIVGLVVLALIPLVNHTRRALAAVPASSLESAWTLGMQPRQVLLQLEIPLAVRQLLPGLRQVINQQIGLVTVAGAIGVDGLGQLVFTGLATGEPFMVLAGGIGTLLLTLLLDTTLKLTVNG